MNHLAPAPAAPAHDVYLAPEAAADDLATVWRPTCTCGWSDEATYADVDEATVNGETAHTAVSA